VNESDWLGPGVWSSSKEIAGWVSSLVVGVQSTEGEKIDLRCPVDG